MSKKPFPIERDEHPFAQYVRILGKGKRGSRSFTQDEARDAMSMILKGEVEEVQLGAFLMLLRVKEESPEEIAGFVQAVKQHLTVESTIIPDLDWSSYAGKRRHLPWFVLSALLLSDNNFKIFMHGASGHTIGRIYTENVLSYLNLPIVDSFKAAETALAKNSFCYMPLSKFSPTLHRIIELRNTLGLRSPVHSLSRLINPLNAPCVVQGIFHPSYNPVHQIAGQLLGYQRLAVIKGEGGEIERNPDSKVEVRSSIDNELIEEVWPPLFSQRHVRPDELDIDLLPSLWRGKHQDEYAEMAVIGTAAFALRLIHHHQKNQEECLEWAKDLWAQRNKTLL
ncbi:glycosyl transferase family protein [Litoribacillus peritrichatus]|uniref:Glycosyl transferase family protein n=1 Tax=Litoribacillus peritrichatus TaxID=718191 RepID=A0ABP7N1D2_9GAMM